LFGPKWRQPLREKSDETAKVLKFIFHRGAEQQYINSLTYGGRVSFKASSQAGKILELSIAGGDQQAASTPYQAGSFPFQYSQKRVQRFGIIELPYFHGADTLGIEYHPLQAQKLHYIRTICMGWQDFRHRGNLRDTLVSDSR
jgi:hypothetical protein